MGMSTMLFCTTPVFAQEMQTMNQTMDANESTITKEFDDPELSCFLEMIVVKHDILSKKVKTREELRLIEDTAVQEPLKPKMTSLGE